jgi:hypothetical protein
MSAEWVVGRGGDSQPPPVRAALIIEYDAEKGRYSSHLRVGSAGAEEESRLDLGNYQRFRLALEGVRGDRDARGTGKLFQRMEVLLYANGRQQVNCRALEEDRGVTESELAVVGLEYLNSKAS